ncbi:hypothetical protein BKA93DRAFT_751006 [Sparassis latifolia]
MATKVYKHIFTGPSSALEDIKNKTTKHPQTREPIGRKACFYISKQHLWSENDGQFNNGKFFNAIIELLSDKEDENTQETLTWWNEQVFGKKEATSTVTEPAATSVTQIKAQRAARCAANAANPVSGRSMSTTAVSTLNRPASHPPELLQHHNSLSQSSTPSVLPPLPDRPQISRLTMHKSDADSHCTLSALGESVLDSIPMDTASHQHRSHPRHHHSKSPSAQDQQSKAIPAPVPAANPYPLPMGQTGMGFVRGLCGYETRDGFASRVSQ